MAGRDDQPVAYASDQRALVGRYRTQAPPRRQHRGVGEPRHDTDRIREDPPWYGWVLRLRCEPHGARGAEQHRSVLMRVHDRPVIIARRKAVASDVARRRPLDATRALRGPDEVADQRPTGVDPHEP